MEKSLLKPKYWIIWLTIGIARIIVLLPYKFQMHLAVFIGKVLRPIFKKRNNIAKINIQIAFPEKNKQEIKHLVNESYNSASMAAFESLIAWFMPKKLFKKIVFDDSQLTSFIEAHKNKDRPVICLGSHFHCLEIIGRHSSMNYKPLTLVYQKHKHPVMEYIITSSRLKYAHNCFQRKNMLAVIKSLKKNISLWYAPDQDFKEHSTFAPFFGKSCSTLTITPWLAKKTKAIVIPTYYIRNKDLSGYKLVSGEEITFTGNTYNDAKIGNEFLEKAIRKYPEQYLWQHRRYKTRPKGEKYIY